MSEISKERSFDEICRSSRSFLFFSCCSAELFYFLSFQTCLFEFDRCEASDPPPQKKKCRAGLAGQPKKIPGFIVWISMPWTGHLVIKTRSLGILDRIMKPGSLLMVPNMPVHEAPIVSVYLAKKWFMFGGSECNNVSTEGKRNYLSSQNLVNALWRTLNVNWILWGP